MGMFEQIIRDHIFVDFGCEVLYGDDQVYLDYPIRFATVGFQLMSTSVLSGIVDRIRKDQGFTPLHPIDEYTDEMCDGDAFYDFFIDLNDCSQTKAGTCIEAAVCNSHSSDEGELYIIELTLDEQIALYNRLDEQCRQYLGKSCAELLSGAKERMEENR